MRTNFRSALAVATLVGVGLLTAACGSSATTASSGASSAVVTSTTAAGSTASASTSASTAASASASSSNYPVDLQPSTAAPGSNVSVYGMSCSASTGTATSEAFTGKVALSMLSNATGGIATVKSGLAAGQYPVTITCGSITVTGTLTVS